MCRDWNIYAKQKAINFINHNIFMQSNAKETLQYNRALNFSEVFRWILQEKRRKCNGRLWFFLHIKSSAIIITYTD